MAMTSVSDFSLFINEQIKAQEQIGLYLRRVEALMSVAVITNDFYGLSERTLHNYFSVASDLIEEAAKANETNLNKLLRQDR